MLYNFQMITLGIDEVGRGPWAGPLVVGAVVLGEAKIEGLTDSKKLSKKRREKLSLEILAKANCGLGWVPAQELDEIGLSAALRLATRRAVSEINCSYGQIIIDGTINFLADTKKGKYATTLPKADFLVPEVSAASIIAKVARDNYMERISEEYPEYNFDSHVGYGTAKHRAAIEKYGICPEHRKSFRPISEISHERVNAEEENTTKKIGDKAEKIVAEMLKNKGHEILARNWKNKVCEIDIVSEFEGVIYFTEVKYREKTELGDGLAAITPKKLKQMNFAVENYLFDEKINGKETRMQVVAVAGKDFLIDGCILV